MTDSKPLSSGASLRRLRTIYAAALLTIAAITLTGQLSLRWMIERLASDAALINDAGRQRMLSQRIAHKGLRLSSAVDAGHEQERQEALVALGNALELWEVTHADLDERARRDRSGTTPDQISRLYELLEPHYQATVSTATRLANVCRDPLTEWPAPALDEQAELVDALSEELRRHADEFLPIMDRIVSEYESRSRAGIESVAAWELVLALVTLVALAVQAVFVFEPVARRMRRAVERAEGASAAKSDFLTNMSHELRTPMTSILGYAELLSAKEHRVDPVLAEEASLAIQANGRHLMALIDNVLDLSKIEAGKMTLEHIEMSPTHVVEEAVSLLRSQATDKGLSLSVECAGPVPATIRSAPTRIRQILVNLIGNAIKFTPEGSVLVRLRALPLEERLVIEVIDTGIGMTPQQRVRISRYDAFSQADGSTSRKFGGTGLGLRISSQLAQRLGDGLRVESSPGEGSTFSVALATGSLAAVEVIGHDADASAAGPHRSDEPDASHGRRPLEGVRVLMVDDGPDNRRLISFHLASAGAHVETANDGREAVERFTETAQSFDLVLMDMQMPEMDGYEATRRLREARVSIPVIAFTAHAMSDDRRRCMDAGCDDYQTKPIERETLIRACTNALESKNKGRDAA
ncbi:MAG: response regulator [Planctomycetota bacterium]